MTGCLDFPAPSELCDPLSFKVEGWLEKPGRFSALEVWVGDARVGGTQLFYARPDVNRAQGWTGDTLSGFTVLGHSPAGPFGNSASLLVRGCSAGAAPVDLFHREIRFMARDYRTMPHGKLLSRDISGPWTRDDIFGSGPSQDDGNRDLLALLLRYLGQPPTRVLDVGCGLGWYGRHLLAAGHAWHGVEIKPGDCAHLSRSGLPHTRTDGSSLPFATGAYDAAMAIEVLEHIADPRAFLAELGRVAPTRLLVSVPNCELVTYLQPYRAVPWHMLEADHRNFFTRRALEALVGEFYPKVEVIGYDPYALPSPEGTTLPHNLLAIASR